MATSAPARAQAYVVNTLGDPAGPGCDTGAGFAGSLRQCILQANVGGAVTNTITFTVTGVITLTQGEIAVSGGQNLIMAGPGARKLAIDGNASSRIFNLANATTLHLDDVTLQNANAASPGGAIRSTGTLDINGVNFTGNKATDSAAIFTLGAAVSTSVANSTFTGNQAVTSNAGVFEEDAGTTTMTNVTVTGNSAAGGYPAFANCAGTWSLTSSTITSNTAPNPLNGALASCSAEQFAVTDTIISGNSIDCKPGVVTDDGWNLDSAHGCGFATGSPKFDQIDTDPTLSALANNGGSTNTQALKAGSPAIDAGSTPVCISADQRNSARSVPGDPVCDIGAYEFGTPIITSVNPTSGTSTCGTTVTVNGLRLIGLTAVTFGSNPATNLVINGDASATVTCPAGVGTVHVIGTNADGVSAATAADQFAYAAAAVVPALPAAGSGPGRAGLYPAVAAAGGLIALVAGGLSVARRRRESH